MNRTLEDLRLTLTALVYAEEGRALLTLSSPPDPCASLVKRVWFSSWGPREDEG